MASVSGPVATKSVSAAKAVAAYKIFTNTDGTVVRWNPCTPIRYAVNTADAADPQSALADVQAAVGRVASASGLTFVFDGQTTVVPTKSWLDSGNSTSASISTGSGSAGENGSSAALVIAWAPAGTAAGHSDLFGTDADGEGGWWESGTSVDGVHWVWQIKRGFVVIDPAGAHDYRAGFGTGETRGVLLMHELGHAVGLGHVADTTDVMFPVISASSPAVWGVGDLAGLALVGRNAGCIP